MKTGKEITSGEKIPGKNITAKQNKDLVQRAVEEIWNGEDYKKVEDFVSNDFVVHLPDPDQKIRGPQGVKQFYTQLRKAFPDIHFTIKDQIAEEDKVVTYWTARGTHKGEFKGIPPTGRQFSLTAIDIDRIVDGKVVECWTNMDELGLLQQLGVIPVSENKV